MLGWLSCAPMRASSRNISMISNANLNQVHAQHHVLLCCCTPPGSAAARWRRGRDREPCRNRRRRTPGRSSAARRPTPPRWVGAAPRRRHRARLDAFFCNLFPGLPAISEMLAQFFPRFEADPATLRLAVVAILDCGRRSHRLTERLFVRRSSRRPLRPRSGRLWPP